jgi:hypothetical protein
MKESACIPLADGIAVEQTAIESPPAMKPSSEDLDGRDYLAGVVREAVSRNPAPAKFLPELSAHPSHSVRRLAYRIRANMADFRPLLQSLSQSTECESWKEITLLLRRSVRRTPEMRKNLKSQLTLFSETTAMELYRMWTMPLPASGEKWSESELAYLVPRLEHPRPEVRVTAMETLRLGGMTELTGNPVSDPNRWSSVVHRWKNLRHTAEGRFR